MVAHQVGKAMEKAASDSEEPTQRVVVKPTGEQYKHTSVEPRAQDRSILIAGDSRKTDERHVIPTISATRPVHATAW